MPLESQQNHLLIIEDDRGLREFLLDAPTYSIGRDSKCDIRLISQFVSRHHATLIQVKDNQTFHYRIVDGNAKGHFSANGLLINGRKLKSHDLHNEDEVVFGPNVRAIYYMLQRDTIVTVPPDEFDITLISPNMVGDPEDTPLVDGKASQEDDKDDDTSTSHQVDVHLSSDKLEGNQPA